MPMTLEQAANALGVNLQASQNEIKKRYHKLAFEWHPDKVRQKFPKASEQEIKQKEKEFNDKIKKINEAYEILMNPQKAIKKDYNYKPAPASASQPKPAMEFSVIATCCNAKEAHFETISFKGQSIERFEAFLKSLKDLKYSVNLTFYTCTLSKENSEKLIAALKANKEIINVTFIFLDQTFVFLYRHELEDICLRNKKEKGIFEFSVSFQDEHGAKCSKILSYKEMSFPDLKAYLKALKSKITLNVNQCFLTAACFEELCETIKSNSEIITIGIVNKNCNGLSYQEGAQLENLIKKPEKSSFYIHIAFEDNGFQKWVDYKSDKSHTFRMLNQKLSTLKKNVHLDIRGWCASDAEFQQFLNTCSSNPEIVSVSFTATIGNDGHMSFGQKTDLERACFENKKRKAPAMNNTKLTR